MHPAASLEMLRLICSFQGLVPTLSLLAGSCPRVGCGAERSEAHLSANWTRQVAFQNAAIPQRRHRQDPAIPGTTFTVTSRDLGGLVPVQLPLYLPSKIKCLACERALEKYRQH